MNFTDDQHDIPYDRTIAGIPTAKFRARLIGMTSRRGNMPMVRELLEQFEQGLIEYPQLVGVLASHQFTERPELHGWGEVYDHAEAMPDDDDLFWLYSAEDLGILSEVSRGNFRRDPGSQSGREAGYSAEEITLNPAAPTRPTPAAGRCRGFGCPAAPRGWAAPGSADRRERTVAGIRTGVDTVQPRPPTLPGRATVRPRASL
jgi:hypothetical protein